MKKILLSLAIALLGCTAFSVSAQNPAMQNKMYQPQKFTDFAFEGILLDLPQQQRMDSLNAAVKAFQEQQQDYTQIGQDNQNSINKQSAKSDKKGSKSDKKTKRQGKEFIREKLGQRGSMRNNPYGPDYIYKVKEILTPEQYTTFLENIVMMPYNKAAQNNLPPMGR